MEGVGVDVDVAQAAEVDGGGEEWDGDVVVVAVAVVAAVAAAAAARREPRHLPAVVDAPLWRRRGVGGRRTRHRRGRRGEGEEGGAQRVRSGKVDEGAPCCGLGTLPRVVLNVNVAMAGRALLAPHVAQPRGVAVDVGLGEQAEGAHAAADALLEYAASGPQQHDAGVCVGREGGGK